MTGHKSYKTRQRTLHPLRNNLPRKWKRKNGGTYDIEWLFNILHSIKVALIIIINILWCEIEVILFFVRIAST